MLSSDAIWKKQLLLSNAKKLRKVTEKHIRPLKFRVLGSQMAPSVQVTLFTGPNAVRLAGATAAFTFNSAIRNLPPALEQVYPVYPSPAKVPKSRGPTEIFAGSKPKAQASVGHLNKLVGLLGFIALTLTLGLLVTGYAQLGPGDQALARRRSRGNTSTTAFIWIYIICF